ncbi:MFS transporter [Streptomyces sp. NPDC059567]|uniref:MFS transporter n=1 Tax=Streptomyces sp. NPDC059567 TaxID=3346867 RepID=UPI00369D56BA
MIGLVPTAALAGCMTGFALLLPLTDHLGPNRLVTAQLTALAAALALAAAAPGAAVLLAAYLVIGAAAGVAAQAGSIAGRHAPSGRSGRSVATVAAGMSAGILLTAWWAAQSPTSSAGDTCSSSSPPSPSSARSPPPRYCPGSARTPASDTAPPSPRSPRSCRHHPQLRAAVATGGLWYFAFNLTWVALGLALAQPPHSLAPTAIGLYSLAGLLGFAVLPVTGRLVDRYGSHAVITTAVLTAAAGTALLATGLNTPPVVAAGLALFDAGCFAAQAANQTRIIALDPQRSGSLSSVYLVLYFTIGAAGTGLAAPCSTPSAGGARPSPPSSRCSPPPSSA